MTETLFGVPIVLTSLFVFVATSIAFTEDKTETAVLFGTMLSLIGKAVIVVLVAEKVVYPLTLVRANVVDVKQPAQLLHLIFVCPRNVEPISSRDPLNRVGAPVAGSINVGVPSGVKFRAMPRNANVAASRITVLLATNR